jgi:hypothetical protein
MEKRIYANGNFVGVQFSELTEEEKIGKRISEIVFELKHVNNIYNKFMEEQLELRRMVKSGNLGYFKAQKVKKEIMQHRYILNGIQTYVKLLNGEREKLERLHPNRMEPTRTKKEKLLYKQNRIIERCNKCSFPNYCKECYVFTEKKEVEEKLKKLN